MKTQERIAGRTIETGAGSSLELESGELLSLRRVAGQGLLCLSGIVWVTQKGDPRDHLLREGEGMLIETSDRVVIQALKDARVTVFSTEKNGADSPAELEQSLFNPGSRGDLAA